VQRAASADGVASLDEARNLWQAVLVRASLGADGPSLEELLAGGERAAGQLAWLQARLRRASSAAGAAVGSGDGDIGAAGGAGSSGGGDSLQAQLWARIHAASAASAAEAGGPPTAAGSEVDLPQRWLDAASLQEQARTELQASPSIPAPYPGGGWSSLWGLSCPVRCQPRAGAASPRAWTHPLGHRPSTGARPLLRWEQDIYLHALSATAPHPKERRVVLSVHAAQLAEEAGLTRAALKHMLRVAGPSAQGGRCGARSCSDSSRRMLCANCIALRELSLRRL
jgi:hypothetical protein